VYHGGLIAGLSGPRPYMNSANDLRFDVLVAGGGPAGSTVAALLARKGLKVKLVERDRHPRFHIGESLLPMNRPIFERLGVLEKVEAIGKRKLGADFQSASVKGYGTFLFSRSLRPTAPYAWQVRRDQFDEMLFRHAAEQGVDAEEGAHVQNVRFDELGVSAELRSENGGTEVIRSRYFVDASGRDTLLGSQLKLKRKHPEHQSAALFAHFRNAMHRPGDDAGNISIYRFAQGWIWMIPLPDGLMSVGAVCWPEYLKQRRGRGVEFLLETLSSVPDVADRLRDAEVEGNFHVTGNYSYACNPIAGRRWLLTGDAIAFVDPIFSTGVYLAMDSAEQAAEVVAQSLRDPRAEARLQKRYGRRLQAGLQRFSWFIYRFTSPAMAQMFSSPRNFLQVEEAVISMLAGDVFRDQGVRWRLFVFRMLYRITRLGMLGKERAAAAFRRRQIRESFSGGTTSQDHV
jgi:flavin-dependent dehydrogenase